MEGGSASYEWKTVKWRNFPAKTWFNP